MFPIRGSNQGLWNRRALGTEQVVSLIPGSVEYISYPMFIEPTISRVSSGFSGFTSSDCFLGSLPRIVSLDGFPGLLPWIASLDYFRVFMNP